MSERKIILPEHIEAFCNSTFVPYPSAGDAVDMILETGNEIIDAGVRIRFYEDIIKGVKELLDHEREGGWYE